MGTEVPGEGRRSAESQQGGTEVGGESAGRDGGRSGPAPATQLRYPRAVRRYIVALIVLGAAAVAGAGACTPRMPPTAIIRG